jgi:hypothetical protein
MFGLLTIGCFWSMLNVYKCVYTSIHTRATHGEQFAYGHKL